MFEIYEVMFEINIKDEGLQRQTMKAPKEILIVNFLQLAKQIQNDPRTITIKMIRPVTIWDPFEQKQRVLNNVIELRNRD